MTTPAPKNFRAWALTLAVLSLGVASTAVAWENQPRYDRRIEEAAIRILQPKLGVMRGSLDLDAEAHFFPRLSQRREESGGPGWPAATTRVEQLGSVIRY